MESKKTRLTAFLSSLRKNLLSSPLELTLGLVYYLIFLFKKPLESFLESKGFRFEFPDLLIWFIPQILLVFCLRRLARHGRIWSVLSVLAWFLWVPVLFWGSAHPGWGVVVAYLLAATLLFLGTERMDSVPFARSVYQTGIGLAEGGVVTLLIMGLISAIIASVKYLFNLSFNNDVHGYNYWFCFLVVLPMLCVSLLETNREGDLKAGSFLRIMVDWVLSPALVIYSLVLYGYIIRILIRGELPNGGVAYMVLGFVVVALVCYLLRLAVEKRHFEWFYKAFPLIAIPPLVLLWIGVLRRVREYGFTETRVYLFALAILSTFFVTMLLNARSRRFQLMAVILALSAAALTYVPGIRAKDFGIRSQLSRMEKLLPDVLVDGHFPYFASYSELAADSLRSKRVAECHDIWRYLKGQMDSTAFLERLGGYGDFAFHPWRLSRARDAMKDSTAAKSREIRAWSLSQDIDRTVDLGPYTQLVPTYRISGRDGGLVFSWNEVELLSCPIRERMDHAGEATLPEDILIYENGQYKAVFWELEDCGERFVSTTGFPKAALFKKPD